MVPLSVPLVGDSRFLSATNNQCALSEAKVSNRTCTDVTYFADRLVASTLRRKRKKKDLNFCMFLSMYNFSKVAPRPPDFFH